VKALNEGQRTLKYHRMYEVLRTKNMELAGTPVEKKWSQHLQASATTAAGPQVWNSLPTQLRESDITLGQLGRALKTHLFGYGQLQRRMTVFFMRCVKTDW